jgi:hypothetical protein
MCPVRLPSRQERQILSVPRRIGCSVPVAALLVPVDAPLAGHRHRPRVWLTGGMLFTVIIALVTVIIALVRGLPPCVQDLYRELRSG